MKYLVILLTFFLISIPAFPQNRPGGQMIYHRENNLPPDYPAPAYTYTGTGAAPGYIFYTPAVRLTPQWEKYITIWDNYGTPVYYRRVNKNVTDFKVLEDGTLTFAVNGLQNPGLNCYYLMDSHYDIYDSIRAGNGYHIDNHDILKMDNGHYLILIYDQQVVNMSLIVPGGDPAALVTGLVIQEVDNAGNVYFEWKSWDHFEITDATWDIDLTSHWIDYVHANAIDLDSDGNILISSRHLDEITKIDYPTGEIIWRFGRNSENNQFTIINDPLGFSHQHDIRKLANGNYTVYDNGNLHVPPFSRALEYHINEETMEATLVWQYEHDPPIYAPMTGSNQRLPNNNKLIGWGSTAPLAVTEVNPSNQVVLEIYLPDSVTGYRARKYNWETNMFSAQDHIDFGNFEGSTGPKRYLLEVTNNYSQSIQITSTYNREPDFFSTNLLPLTIIPGGKIELQVSFLPSDTGLFRDDITLNYDNEDNTERIARQVRISGIWKPSLPSLQFIPSNGTQNVDPNSVITITFSEPMRKIFHQELQDSDIPNLFVFKEKNPSGNDIVFHGTISGDKMVMTLVPDEILDEMKQYYIELKPNLLEDYQGNVMTYSDFCFFSTGNAIRINDPEGEGNVQVYPNPVSGILHVQTGGEEITRISIYSNEGRLLVTEPGGSGDMRISVGHMPAGMLTVEVVTGTGNTRIFRVLHQ